MFYRPKPGRRVAIEAPASLAGPEIAITGTICWISNEDGAWHAGVAFDRPCDTAAPAPQREPGSAIDQDELFRSDWSSGAA